MISISTSKSGSNWLDRLRSSRGFPTGSEPDLDRFLASSSSCSSGSSTRSESTQFPRRVNSVGPQNDAVAAVLSHLFNMGERSSITAVAAVSRKKNCRKQSNPKFFNSANLGKNNKELCSSSGDNDNDNDNVVVVVDKVLDDNDDDDNEDEEESDDDDYDHDNRVDMKEYTRSEVTVIDTSLSDWKIDKLVFRRNNDWKIKDKKKNKNKKKKSNHKVNYSKKRKLLGNEDDDDDDDDDNVDDVVKRMSVVGGDVDVETKFKEKKKILHMNKPRNDKARELLKEAAEFVGKVPQTRCPCPRPPDKLRIESSPVIPLKSIPSCNNANPDKLRIDNSPVILLKSIPSINNANGIMRLGKSAKKGRPKKFAFI